MAGSYYNKQASALNRELKQLIGAQRLKELHEKRPALHVAIAFRQIALLVGMPLLIYHFQQPWIWIPAMILQGIVVFSFTVLLHEVVHKAIFKRDPHNVTQALGYLYGTLSGLAYSQFRCWHLDHHDHLGTFDKDPKRAFLSPKINARWYKFLYATPVLYPIYFRAAYCANQTYPPALQARIKKERLVSIGFHVGIMAAFALFVSPVFALKAWAIPIFCVFPAAFMLNRLGQHYVIDPDDVAKWSTLMRPNFVWNFLFLYSSYHLEHHYFPAVPFYNLKALQKELDPFFAKRRVPSVSYTRLLKLWFVDNHKPHTRDECLGELTNAHLVKE